MKFITIAALLATAAMAMATPVEIEERQSNEYYKHYADCQQVPHPKQETGFIPTVPHVRAGRPTTDASQDGLFSYSRPDNTHPFGLLTIVNGTARDKVIEFQAGDTRVSYVVHAGRQCRVEEYWTEIQNYRVWDV